MLVKARVYNVQKTTSNKVKAEVSLLVSDPDALIRIRLFEFHEKVGALKVFQSLVGKDVLVPLEVETYRGQLQYSLAYGLLPRLSDIAETGQ